MYRALVSFSGRISMAVGEVREISDKEVVKDLLNAKYIEEVNAKPKAKPKAQPKEEHEAEPKEEKPKKKTSAKRKKTTKK